MATARVEMEAAHTESMSGGRLLAAVSNAIVRIYAHSYGRGPTRAQSHWAGPDTIVCVMQDVFDAGEKTLIDLGQATQVRSTRLAFRDGLERAFIDAVESLVGRKVDAFIGQVTATVPEYGVEVFLFEPLPTNGAGNRHRADVTALGAGRERPTV